MIVYPTVVAFFRVSTLDITTGFRIENLVQTTCVYIPQCNIQVLTQGYIAVRMNDQLAEYAVASQLQSFISPFVVQCYEIVVFFCPMYG